MACRRFLDDLEKSKTDPEYPWAFDEHKAARPVDFIERFLVPTKGDYDKMVLMDWQCFIECNLFGWVDKETGLRRFQEALIVVGSGNGKSTMMAGNATFMACKDGEQGPEIYLLANSKDQAGIVFNECKAQIDASRFLAPRFRTLRDGVYYDKAHAVIRHRSSDSKRLDGLNPHGAIFDEIHEYRDFKLLNIIKKKTIKRKQPLIMYITTIPGILLHLREAQRRASAVPQRTPVAAWAASRSRCWMPRARWAATSWTACRGFWGRWGALAAHVWTRWARRLTWRRTRASTQTT